MDRNEQLDDELAKMTDTVLKNQSAGFTPHEEMDDLVSVVQQLNNLIRPSESLPPAFDERLRERLEFEFNKRTVRRSRFRKSPFIMLASAAAVILVAASVLFLLTYETEPNLLGTAEGAIWVIPVVLIVTIVIVTAIIVAVWRRG